MKGLERDVNKFLARKCEFIIFIQEIVFLPFVFCVLSVCVCVLMGRMLIMKNNSDNAEECCVKAIAGQVWIPAQRFNFFLHIFFLWVALLLLYFAILIYIYNIIIIIMLP